MLRRTARESGHEFMGRSLQHDVLPKGLHKVRYYGLWHPAHVDGSPHVSRLRRSLFRHLNAGRGRRPPRQTWRSDLEIGQLLASAAARGSRPELANIVRQRKATVIPLKERDTSKPACVPRNSITTPFAFCSRAVFAPPATAMPPETAV